MMSAARHLAVSKYVRDLRGLMNLFHFTVTVPNEYEALVRGATVFASSEVTADSANATIRIGEPFFESTPDEQRNTICHELIHLHVDALFQHVYGSVVLKEQLGSTTFAFVEESGRSLMERTVDQLANGWAELLPLPPKFPK